MELLENNQTQTLADLARLSETSSEDYLAQLRSTELLDSREKALEGMKARELLAATPRISEFLKSRGLAKGDETQWFGIDENSNAILRLNANFLRG